ncbi:DnaJ domain-containing protein, partial [Flammula alnicola]
THPHIDINRTRPRDLPTASPAAITQALKHKSAGTEQFKLGQYGSAAESYSLAISAMPDGHLLLVPLYTNRALARLKTGEYVAAGEDCMKALGIIVGGSSASSEGDSFGLAGSVSDGPRTTVWSPVIEPKEVIAPGESKANEAGWAHPQGLGVNLCDGYVKALRRRAEAWEGREKWSEAGKDWEVLAGSGAGAQWVAEGVRREAVRVRGGVGGCAPSVSSASTPNQASKPIPRPKPKPKPVVSDPTPSQALRALRSSNAQAEADDILKHSLKDSVDARLNAWRTGKETNIRALLASLDVILWEEILRGGVKVNGLGDLVTPAQVKKGYVRAIGKVHPDKLNASNSTVEKCMLANGVFGTLNEAWIAFQAGQK